MSKRSIRLMVSAVVIAVLASVCAFGVAESADAGARGYACCG